MRNDDDSPTIDQMIDALIDREGDYVNHPADRGGPTRFGITEAVARAHGYAGPMALLPRDRLGDSEARRPALVGGMIDVAPLALDQFLDQAVDRVPWVADCLLHAFFSTGSPESQYDNHMG